MYLLSFSSELPRREHRSQQHQRNHQRHKELLKKNILLTKMKMTVDNSVSVSQNMLLLFFPKQRNLCNLLNNNHYRKYANSYIAKTVTPCERINCCCVIVRQDFFADRFLLSLNNNVVQYFLLNSQYIVLFYFEQEVLLNDSL